MPVFRCFCLRGARFSRCALVAAVLLVPAAVRAHGDLHQRIGQLMAEIARQPDDAQLHLALASVYCQHGEWKFALAETEAVERLAPGLHLADFLRSEALLGDGKPAEARALLDRLIATQPKNFRALTLRARALAALGQPAACVADYRAALRAVAQPEPDLVQETADALVACGQSDEAVQALGDGIARLGPIPSLMLRAMELEVATGRFDAALSRIDAMQKSAPRPEPWMAKRAELLTQAGRPAEARAAWQALIAHLAALPNLQRGSHAMSLLAERARQALAQIDSVTSAHVFTSSFSSR